MGSFVKALADRSLQKRSFWGRSYCPHCKKVLQWYDLLPIFSYLILKGKCRYCGRKIGVEYLTVEVVMGALVGFLFWQGFNFDSVFKIFFVTILAILFLTDLKKMLIPDRIVLPAIVLSLAYLIGVTLFKIGYLYYYLSQTPIGRYLLPPHSNYFQRHAQILAEPLTFGVLMGLLIGGFFMGLIIITRGKGMGGGDVKLGAFIGLGLGFPASLVAMMVAFLTGAIFSIIAIILGKKHFGQHIPFGPFLVIGALGALFWGEQIVDFYLKLGA